MDAESFLKPPSRNGSGWGTRRPTSRSSSLHRPPHANPIDTMLHGQMGAAVKLQWSHSQSQRLTSSSQQNIESHRCSCTEDQNSTPRHSNQFGQISLDYPCTACRSWQVDARRHAKHLPHALLYAGAGAAHRQRSRTNNTLESAPGVHFPASKTLLVFTNE